MINKIIFFALFFCLGCSPISKDYERVIEKAGKNGDELSKVIAHYDSLNQPERRDAAYYLIGVMGDKYFWTGDNISDFDSLFRYMGGLRKKKVRVTFTSPLVKDKWRELTHLYGAPSKRLAEKYFDYEYYSAAQIIAHIDQAFRIKDSIVWAKDLSKQEFYEYILPHRIGHERPEEWKQIVYKDFRKFRDTTQATSRMEAARRIHKTISLRTGLNLTLDNYPFDIPYSLMSLGRRGSCPHLVHYMTMAMRGNGLPVTSDYTPLWGSRNGGHHWCVLQLEDGSFLPFDVSYANPFGEIDRPHYSISKVYRKVFRPQQSPSHELNMDVPPELIDNYRIDVTHEYTTTYDIAIDIHYPSDKAKKKAIICTFDNKTWRAQSWGYVKNDRAYFENMGANVLYNVMLYENGELYSVADPFILTATGEIKYTRPSGKQNMLLLRKFPRYPRIKGFEALLIGARVQGANRPDFSDAVDFFTIADIPDKIEEVEVDVSNHFRYVRILLEGRERRLGIAELMFYDDSGSATPLKGKIIGYPELPEEFGTPYQHAFDGNLETYFMTYGRPDESWAGLDLGLSKRITKVRYAPRSDTNFILVGDTYELCIWDGDKWRSLGKQVASDQHLQYQNIPANGLYLLHNLSRGKEERVFTYENGKQVWW